MSTASVITNQITKNSLYLAGMFDSGLGVQLSKRGSVYKVRLTKTSTDPGIAFKLQQKIGCGSVFQTSRGTRWSMENNPEAIALFELIEPYVEVRKDELALLMRILRNEPGDLPQDELYELWKDHRAAARFKA